jgi:hypothetical protein
MIGSGRQRALKGLAVTVVALAIGMPAATATASRLGGPAGPKIAGTIKPSFFISGDKQAIRRLKSSGVWCRWIGDHVWMRIAFRNRLAAHITVQVQPNYRLANAGLHGDGLTSGKSVGINAGAFRAWFGDLGTPDGVSGSPRITKCAPEINSVELG